MATRRPRRGAGRWLLVAFGALICAGALSLSAWSGTPNWSNPDSLYYQAMSYEVEGASAQAARASVFHSPLAERAIAFEPSVASPAWQTFESQFSRRRWLVPALAAAVRPLAGVRALPDVAIVGFILFGLGLCLLLASRFGALSSLGVVALCLALGPLRNWGLRPMTDSWGLALLVAAIATALLALRRGLKWLPLWAAVMLMLSFTRDLAIIPLAGLGWLMLRDRELRRRSLILAVTGILATVPAYALFGASLRLTWAFQMNDFEVPSAAHSTWAYVAGQYPSFGSAGVKADLLYMANHPIVGLTIACGIVALFAISARRDTLVLLMRGAALGWLIVFALDPDFTTFRYELPILPSAAVGLCFFVEFLGVRVARRRSEQTRGYAVAAGPPPSAA